MIYPGCSSASGLGSRPPVTLRQNYKSYTVVKICKTIFFIQSVTGLHSSPNLPRIKTLQCMTFVLVPATADMFMRTFFHNDYSWVGMWTCSEVSQPQTQWPLVCWDFHSQKQAHNCHLAFLFKKLPKILSGGWTYMEAPFHTEHQWDEQSENKTEI